MRPPISYYGGKQNMVRHILPIIPAHTIYCEPFFGGGALFFAKKPARLSAINDTNGWAVTFYRQLKTNFEALNDMVQGTLHSEQSYYEAKAILKDGTGTELETAWAFWVQTNMSFAGKMFGGFAFGNKGTLEDPIPYTDSINSKRKYFANYTNCLESAEIFNRDALDVIRLKDTPKTLHYCDPPYIGSDCGHYKGYTQADFDSLIELLSGIQGKFILSSYPNDALLIAREKHGWRSIDIVQNLSVDGKATQGKTKTECLTFNYPLESERQTTML